MRRLTFAAACGICLLLTSAAEAGKAQKIKKNNPRQTASQASAQAPAPLTAEELDALAGYDQYDEQTYTYTNDDLIDSSYSSDFSNDSSYQNEHSIESHFGDEYVQPFESNDYAAQATIEQTFQFWGTPGFQLNEVDRDRLLAALAELHPIARQQFFTRLADLDAESRANIAQILDVKQIIQDRTVTSDSPIQAYQPLPEFTSQQHNDGTAWGTSKKAPGPVQQSSLQAGHAPEQRRNLNAAGPSEADDSPAGAWSEQQAIAQQLAATLDHSDQNVRAAADAALRTMTADQRVQIMQPIIDSKGAPRPVRNLAFYVLIDTYRELQQFEMSSNLERMMASETAVVPE